MPHLAPNAEHMPRSGIRQIMDLAWSLPGPVIGLHVGEPSFDPPRHVVDAARAAYADGDTHYVPNAGTPALRAALARKIHTQNGSALTPERVVVTAGGAQALHIALSISAAAGDEVLIPDPGWSNYAMALTLLQMRAVRYSLRPRNHFHPDLAELETLVTPRTRVLLMNTPSNPLGTVLPAVVVQDLVRFAQAHDLWLISDECYDALTFDVPHIGPGRFDTDGRVLSCFSFSKTYAMTGVRVGCISGPLDAMRVAAKLQEPLLACVNAPAQAAAVAALEGPQEAVTAMRDTYHARRDAALAQLDAQGIRYLRPDGAFYLWIDVRDRCGSDVTAWSLRLLSEHNVAVAPGPIFGSGGEGWVRVSLAADTDQLLQGLRCFEDVRS